MMKTLMDKGPFMVKCIKYAFVLILRFFHGIQIMYKQNRL